MEVIDIAVIGSGIASTLTLIEVLNALLDGAPRQQLTITIIEKNQEFWKGIPYGARSSVNALTITSIHDFINEKERAPFFEWLKATRQEWSAWYRLHGGITADRWLTNNLKHIDDNNWETVYVPRFLYGNYLQQKLLGLMQRAEQRNLATIRQLHAEAIDVQAGNDGIYQVTAEYPDSAQTTIAARKVVIAAGSAPVRKMCDQHGDAAIYFNDLYEPSVNANISTLQAALGNVANESDRNILIIGSNASSIELLYLLEGLPAVRSLINKIVIISTSGILPYHVSTKTLDSHPLPNLDVVKAAGTYTITALVDAAAEDIKLAVQDGANMDYVATVISTTLQLMSVLSDDDKKAFFAIHGVRLRDSFRRSGPEYKGVSELLQDLGQVTLLKGRFLSAAPAAAGVALQYQDVVTGEEKTYPLPFRAIINCSGSADLDQSSSRLLYNLVHNGICSMNLSRKGFEVNEHFEAAPHLYIMGPLLGGNMNSMIHFWQLENASRLTSLAPHLAVELLND